jgi:transmembrane 9 superfamily protein 2/4
VDNLSAASKMKDNAQVTTRYWQGFPVGFIGDDDNKAYVHNHVNIELFYHRAIDGVAPGDDPVYRIVKFIVEPFSIAHDMDPTALDAATTLAEDHGNFLPEVAKINNPIQSCDPTTPYENRPHTNYGMVMDQGQTAQQAAGKVLFTYDVIWTEDPDTTWASRWDVYLDMNGAVPAKVHWVSILNSMVIVYGQFGTYPANFYLKLSNCPLPME